MDNFGSEIGQKMRSAVKAKLLELGTGGSAGYIDDELPDYVMIMVANKRSKQQMIADLNLFLGTQTVLFVTWLHEVLQKLQEVTLPAANATNKKRKNSQREEAASSSTTGNKKDKKSGKKEKKSTVNRKLVEEGDNGETEETQAPTTTSSPPVAVPIINSITDVFAEDLLEKAKKTLDVNAEASSHIKKGKGKKATVEAEDLQENAKEAGRGAAFDIPTISEISSTTGAVTSGNREQDLAELAEIQKKIYAAKKQLKHLGTNEGESEDEDFLNLKDDGSAEEFDEEGDLVKKKSTKAKSPIVFDKKDASGSEDEGLSSKRRRVTPPPLSSAAIFRAVSPGGNRRAVSPTSTSKRRAEDAPTRRSRERERREPPVQSEKKRSVHERLGLKTAPMQREESARERRNRQDKELYVPAFRRRELENERERLKERDKQRAGEHVPERERERVRDKEREGERTRDRDRVRERSSTRRRTTPSNEQQPSSSSSTTGHKRSQIDSTRNRRGSSANDQRSVSPRANRSASPRTQRQRIGSRVIVATNKPPEPSDDEDMADKPVNSVIKIKPRAPVSPSKQACKNLLLRAVAEAQRSTVLSKPKPVVPENAALTKVTVHLGEAGVVSSDRNTKLFTKSYRDRLKRGAASASSTNLFRRTTQNLVIEVEAGSGLKTAELRKRRRANSQQDADMEPEEEYVPETMSDRGESDGDYVYVPQLISRASGDEDDEQDVNIDYHINEAEFAAAGSPVEVKMEKTQFVVTLNDEKSHAKNKRRPMTRSRSRSPLPQVTSSSSATARNNAVEASSSTCSSSTRNKLRHASATRDSHRRSDIKSRLKLKTSSLSPATAARLGERDSNNSSPSSNTPPPTKRSELIEIYRKPKEIKKIIIKNDSEDDESPKKSTSATQHEKHDGSRAIHKRRSEIEKLGRHSAERSTTPPLPSASNKRHSAGSAEKLEKVLSPTARTPTKRKRTPIKFDLNAQVRGRIDDCHDGETPSKRRSKSYDRDNSQDRRSGDDFPQGRQKISIRNTEARKYENIPSLSSVTIDSTVIKVNKPKERCKYHPNCTKHNCDFYHPTAPCKSFPNCKFAEKCIYSHPRCKFDIACANLDCNFSHSGPRNPNLLQPTAPPLSSHVVPVQNYKSISAAPAASSTMCKYYPNCSKMGCTFYHPKPCRFGKNCINKLECNFYHHELQSSSKFKWVASVV